jgi:hypothetical protein
VQSTTDQDFYHELSYYTLAHPDPSFIHQHIVDAYAAQHADESAKPIGVVFALIGLYLHVEKNFTGRQVQKAHMMLAKRPRQWLRPHLAQERGAITVRNVVAAAPGQSRDAMIHKWCASVWGAWNESGNQIADLVSTDLDIN